MWKTLYTDSVTTISFNPHNSLRQRYLRSGNWRWKRWSHSLEFSWLNLVFKLRHSDSASMPLSTLPSSFLGTLNSTPGSTGGLPTKPYDTTAVICTVRQGLLVFPLSTRQSRTSQTSGVRCGHVTCFGKWNVSPSMEALKVSVWFSPFLRHGHRQCAERGLLL